ncbi:hypothetical protein GCM10009118_34230 [Wandonia haliotis]|uniref:Lipoprotein n=1 Tax=Wandonia haliotis TaxID=574963 RepID=A0ABN1MVP2_9FLAO
MNKIYIYIIVLFSAGCSTSKKVDEIVSNNLELNESLLKSSLYSRNEFYIYETYFIDGVRTYYCELNNENYNIVRDTIIYKSVSGSVYNNNFKLSPKQVSDSIKRLKQIMNTFSIEGYRSDWRDTGIALKIYLTDGCEMFYVPNQSSFINQYSDLEKLKRGWYSRCVETQ